MQLIPSGLRLFSYRCGGYPQSKFTEIMQRLNPTLHTLNLGVIRKEETAQSLKELKNTQDFRCSVLVVSEAFVSFLKSNKAHMRRLSFRPEGPEALRKGSWSAVAQMGKFEFNSLTVDHSINCPS